MIVAAAAAEEEDEEEEWGGGGVGKWEWHMVHFETCQAGYMSRVHIFM
jgi:hypothetical protein